MKFKKLYEGLETPFQNALEDEFGRNFQVWNDDGGRYYYLDLLKPELYTFDRITIGPLDNDPSEYSDFSELVTVKQLVNYNPTDENRVLKILRNVNNDIAKRVKRAVSRM